MADQITKVTDLINPEVMADMISAKLPNKIVVLPFAKIDTTLVGRPGDTITIPKYKYIGDAEDVAEGVKCETVKLEADTTTATVKKAMKAVDITDEALLSGYGNPSGEATNQLANAIASKVDNDAMDALFDATLIYDGSAEIISYNGVVDAVDVFNEERNSEKAIYINPHQLTQLRKDENFINADKYPGHVVVTGEVGMIANCHVVPSRKATLNEAGYYECPIVKLNNDEETEDDTAALTIFLKRDVNVEAERNSLCRKTAVSADEIYTVALTDESKVVLAKFAAQAAEPAAVANEDEPAAE